jgi:dTDP-4-dehydrorhamnose reductase
MKILITGSNGMLGRALCQEMSSKYEVVGIDILRLQDTDCRFQTFIQCDITKRKETIAEIVSLNPDVIIHAAAYTDVDACELNKEKAHKINALGTETVALASQECNAFLFYISTDFVFDGEKKSAYIESDEPNPINIYGQSKLEGEKYVQSIVKKFIIIRTSWLFGKGGKNFVNTILEKAQNEKEVKVVCNQCGSPTYTKDLASAISRLISVLNSLNGIYHITNSGSCSWYEFAQAIKDIASLNIDIIPISAAQYHSPTRRPEVSMLENRRYREYFGQKLRPWKEALRMYLSE